MPFNKQKKPKAIPWQDSGPTQQERSDMRDAVVDYACAKKKNAENLSMSMQLVTTIIPYLASIDPKWNGISSDNFNTHEHGRHRVFYDTVKNLLKDKKKLQASIDERKMEYADDEVEGELNEDQSQIEGDQSLTPSSENEHVE